MLRRWPETGNRVVGTLDGHSEHEEPEASAVTDVGCSETDCEVELRVKVLMILDLLFHHSGLVQEAEGSGSENMWCQ
jgi:hypothetical protein